MILLSVLFKNLIDSVLQKGTNRTGKRKILKTGYIRSYQIDEQENNFKNRTSCEVKVFYTRALQLIAYACRADYAMLITDDYVCPHGATAGVYIYPESGPGSDERQESWQPVSNCILKNIRKKVPVSIIKNHLSAFNFKDVLISFDYVYKKALTIIAVFADSSSPPFDSDDEDTLCRLSEKFIHLFYMAISPKNKGSRADNILRVLEAYNVFTSANELCGTFNNLTELPVSLGLAESALICISDRNTGTLKPASVAGEKQNMDIKNYDIKISDCPAMCFAGKTSAPVYVEQGQCRILDKFGNHSAICTPIPNDSGDVGMLSLWNPPGKGLGTADMRIISAIVSSANKAFLSTCTFSGIKERVRIAFIEYAFAVCRNSKDITRVARGLLTGLRKTINFQVGAFVNCWNSPEIFSLLFPASDFLTACPAEPQKIDMIHDLPGRGPLNSILANIILGDPEVEGWTSKALEYLEANMMDMFVQCFYMNETPWPSCMIIPLTCGDDTIGLFIIGRKKGDRFSKDDIDYCSSILLDLALIWENFMTRIKPRVNPTIGSMLERIETLEQLAVRAAHEIKNPLSVIKGCMQMMEIDQRLPLKLKQTIRLLLRQVEQATRVAHDLGDLRELTVGNVSLVSIPSILEEILDIIELQPACKNINIIRAYSDNISNVPGDPDKLRQVFENICRNAIEAMDAGGGELYVKAENSTDRRSVIVEFRDSGPGITGAAMMMLFRPFFTTKGHGTGIGLNIAKSIIEQHGGTIRVENIYCQKGAKITVILPTAH